MSDARPITNVTDYVCSACWNSFGRDMPGVVRDQVLVCPHCGHTQPADGPLDVIAAVNAAPAARASHGSDAFEPLDLSVAPAQVTSLGRDESERAAQGWLPPDLLGPATQTAAGYVAGDLDEAEDFGSAETTLPPDASFEELLAQARAAGDEQPVDVYEPTPPADDEASAAAPERRDWKLKAMGLTYNFHGLDALLGWAANKAGQPMQVSLDGKLWKDFGPFHERLKSGMAAETAFESTGEPGAPPPPLPEPVAAPLLAGTAALAGRTARPTQSRMAASDAKADGTALGGRPVTTSARAQQGAGTSPSRKVPVLNPATAKQDKVAKIAVGIAVLLVVVAVVLVKAGVLPMPGR